MNKDAFIDKLTKFSKEDIRKFIEERGKIKKVPLLIPIEEYNKLQITEPKNN